MSNHPSIKFAMRSLPDELFATQGFAFIGTAGCGKTTFLKLMMQSVLHKSAPSSMVQAFVYDYKSELYPFVYSVLGAQCPEVPLYCVNPFDLRCNWWDIAQDIERESDAQQMAKILVPGEPGEKTPYYRDVARIILSNLMLSFNRHSPRNWRLSDLFHAISNEEIYRSILLRDPDTAKAATRSGSADTQANIDSTINNTYHQFRVLAALLDRARENGHSGFSARAWVNNPGVIIANFDQTVEGVLEPFYRALLQLLTRHTIALPDDDDRRIWYWLDEFHTLKPVPGFENFITNARSKGACNVLNFQNIQTLLDPKHYGPITASIVGECKCKMLFKAPTFEHAEWCAKEYGKHEFLKFQRGKNDSEARRNSRGEEEITYTDGTSHSVDFDISFLREPGEFQALPLVKETGVFNAFAILQSKRLKCSMDFKEATGSLLIPHPCHPGFIRTPPEWEELPPWDEADLERLKIPSSGEDLFSIAVNLKRRPIK